MVKKSPLPVIEVSGKPLEMGREMGKKCARRAVAYRKSIGTAVHYYTGMLWEDAVQKAKGYLPYAQEFDPDFIEELQGFSEGSKLSFDHLFALCCHELMDPQGAKACTDIVANGDVTRDGNVLAGHNEDWSLEQLPTVVLLHAKPKGKPEFFCTSYAGLVPSCGMNSAGISLTGNALSPNDTRIGIPKIFSVRKTLEARRIGEAMEFAMPAGRASSYNNIVCDKNGEMYSLEGSATDFVPIYAIDGYMVHTNHYTTERMWGFESNRDSLSCSTFRYNRALRLLEDQLGSVTPESMIAIFRDHVNKPGSICRHPDPKVHPIDVSETIFSVIFDLTNLEAYILKGKPCSGDYVKHSLRP